ncbi:site-specific tyrosine recombinase XerC [Delftia tsuruhatensis]|uniref:tyrosine-type recombinase/integrase n=1 Tax=Delftia tsuruhatensis TaxID=180282 RepID=UPI001E818D87|nr:tyrosine-type recombinase/integrase [Delftia tsuruhatensis]CAB5716980.1 site-specific tyrosine recombinase XerC [Delftia tsuruhatensis]CAC9683962.1 site-specific tyrosine recombinase XerC [Delftia tsuruhatensis]
MPASTAPSPAATLLAPDGPALFRQWLACEGSKGWNALDTAPDSGYETVWRAWLRSLQDSGARAPGEHPATAGPAPCGTGAPVHAWQQATAVDVQNFLRPRQGQVSHHLPGRRISEVTRRRYWRLLERIYDHALEHGWVMANPAAGLSAPERPPAEDGQGHCLPAPLWQALPRHFPVADGFQSARDRAILLLLYALALAPEEVRGLHWRDVQGTAPPTGLPTTLHIDGARAAQQRVLELPEAVALALRDWHGFSAGQRGPEAIRPDAPVFYSREGQPLSVRVLFHVASQLLQRAHAAQHASSQKAPLHRVGPQVLRNTAIVQWLRDGRSESEVVRLIGVESARALRHLRHYL